MQGTIKTNHGDIVIEFNDKQTPKTVENFKKLAESGFYNGVKFHRIIRNFMIQGGDPLTKEEDKKHMWGTGGPGYKFDDEIGPENSNGMGSISMANAGRNTNGSQFFINVADNHFLNSKHTACKMLFFSVILFFTKCIDLSPSVPINAAYSLTEDKNQSGKMIVYTNAQDIQFGVVNAAVFAIGADKDYIIAKQHPYIHNTINTSLTNFYIIPLNNSFAKNEGKNIIGPLDQPSFDRVRDSLKIAKALVFNRFF